MFSSKLETVCLSTTTSNSSLGLYRIEVASPQEVIPAYSLAVPFFCGRLWDLFNSVPIPRYLA